MQHHAVARAHIRITRHAPIRVVSENAGTPEQREVVFETGPMTATGTRVGWHRETLLMRIGILTGGGDVPGLNPCIKAVVSRAADDGHAVLGIRRGWAGLLETNPDAIDSVPVNVMPLSPAAVRTIDRTGGTVLHTSRTNPGRVKAGGCRRSSPTRP
jgi:Phosphofructokinase